MEKRSPKHVLTRGSSQKTPQDGSLGPDAVNARIFASDGRMLSNI
jgi:hypothetical protein